MPLLGTAIDLATKIVDALLACTACSANPNISAAERSCMIAKWTIICQEWETHYIANITVLPDTFETIDIATGPEPVINTGKIT